MATDGNDEDFWLFGYGHVLLFATPKNSSLISVMVQKSHLEAPATFW